MKKLALVAAALVAPALMLGGWAAAEVQKKAGEAKVLRAVCVVHGTSKGKAEGVIHFVQKGEVVEINGEITGLTPGEHAFHIHEFGDCSAKDANSAGGHYNPTNKKHGAPTDAERHVGDLGNIKADGTGKAVIKMTDKVIRLSGPHSIVGRSVIIHADPDDFKTQPTGHAGDRVGCGVVGWAKN
jgi:superoxide dismutase, Cu-Zn family